MYIYSPTILVHYSLLCLLVGNSLCIPTTASSNVGHLATEALSRYPLASSLDLIRPLNLTSSLRDPSLEFRVPNTYVLPEWLLSICIESQVPRRSLRKQISFSVTLKFAWFLICNSSTDTEVYQRDHNAFLPWLPRRCAGTARHHWRS